MIEDIDKALNLKLYINPQPFIPEEYQDLINIFKKKAADWLPPHYEDYDFKFKFEPGKTLTFSPLYGMSWEEL